MIGKTKKLQEDVDALEIIANRLGDRVTDLESKTDAINGSLRRLWAVGDTLQRLLLHMGLEEIEVAEVPAHRELRKVVKK